MSDFTIIDLPSKGRRTWGRWSELANALLDLPPTKAIRLEKVDGELTRDTANKIRMALNNRRTGFQVSATQDGTHIFVSRKESPKTFEQWRQDGKESK